LWNGVYNRSFLWKAQTAALIRALSGIRRAKSPAGERPKMEAFQRNSGAELRFPAAAPV
jgi:hypothetical protein